MIKASLKIGITSLIFCALAPCANAVPNEIGHVVWVKGTLTASGRSLQRNSPIFVHDVLVTGAASEAEVVLTDSSLITLKENTQYAIDHYKFQSGNNVGYVATLSAGGFRTLTGMIAKRQPSSYHVNTPVATIGVRGTDYQAVYENGVLYVADYSGSVCITTYGGVTTGNCPTGLVSVLQD